MHRSNLNNYHIAIVAPSPEDYETARALLDEPDPEYHLTSSGAACSLGKVGPHNVVLVGKAGDMANVSVFVKDTVDDLLEAFPSIRAGFLIGVDATAPEESLAKPGDIVVALPQGFQPGQVQFDVEETTISNRLSTAYEMSHPPSCITSVINTLQSAEGRQQWGQYLANQLYRWKVSFGCDTRLNRLDSSQPSRVLRGKIASSRPVPDRDFINKIGGDSNIMCFERAAADLESSLPFLTICGIANSTGHTRFPNSVPSAKSQGRLATVIYATFVLHRINPAQLQQEHAFIYLFHYEPFDLESAGFRLVVLEKGSQSQVQCRLYQSHLDDINSYEALSYAWEGQGKLHELIVDGKYLSITASLSDALFHLRKPDEDRVLWIDALCIDQNNIKERGHKVNRMGEIYKKAEKVVIWLGYASGSSVMFQSAVNMFGRNLPSNAFREWSRDDNRWKGQWKLVGAYLGSSSHDELVESIQSLLRKPWFSRVWILQEVANAKRITVGCNLGEVPGKIFSLLPHAMNAKVSEQSQAVLDIMPHRLRRSQNRNLCNLLWEFRGCKATDPRDRIYALLGMASDMENIEIRADYAKEQKEVVREFCSYLLGEGWTASLPAPAIDELQSKLPSLSKELLLQKLKQGEPADSLKQFLNRQGLIPNVDGSDVLDIIQYGSEITSLLLDRNRETVWIPREAALQCLRRHPHVFEVLLRRSDFKIEEMPMFIAQSMEYHPDFLERLLGSSSNPDQLRDAALVAAISLGLSSCRPLLTQCRDSINITKIMLRRAIFCYQESQDVLRYLLDVAQSPVQWSTNLFVEASPGNPRGIRIVDKHSRPVLITREVIEAAMGITAGPEDLQLLLEHMEHPVELDEDLFLKAIAKGAGVVRCLLERCNQPFNVTGKVYARAYKAGMEVFEQILQNSLPDFKNTERNFEMDVKVGANHLRKRLKNLRGKLQITDKVIGVAEDDVTREMLLEMRDAEETVTEDAAIKAIETGPKAFNELYNKPGTNFKVTERILKAVAEQGYALHVLEAGRSSEVIAARRALSEKEKQTHPDDWLERLWRRP